MADSPLGARNAVLRRVWPPEQSKLPTKPALFQKPVGRSIREIFSQCLPYPLLSAIPATEQVLLR